MLEILQAIDGLKTECDKSEDCFWAKVDPYVILISNEPVDARYADVTLDTEKKDPARSPSPCCNEVWSPIRTLLATRSARGVYARETAAWHVGRPNFFHFGLCKKKNVDIPLGWTLSSIVQSEMKQQLEKPQDSCPMFDNPGNLTKIQEILSMHRKERP